MIDNQQRNKINRTKLGLGYEEAKLIKVLRTELYIKNKKIGCYLSN